MLTIIEVIYMVIVGALLLIHVVLNYKQQNKIKAYEKSLHEALTNNDVVMEYCLIRIMNDAADPSKQDYETANKCKVLIEKIRSTKYNVKLK